MMGKQNQLGNWAVCQLVAWLSTVRLDGAAEKRAQGQLEEALEQAGFPYQREKRLSDHDIIDFVVTVGGCQVGVELKTRAQRMQIYRQLERYASHEELDGLVLLTGTAMNLPIAINGTPAMVASLGAGWL